MWGTMQSICRSTILWSLDPRVGVVGGCVCVCVCVCVGGGGGGGGVGFHSGNGGWVAGICQVQDVVAFCWWVHDLREEIVLYCIDEFLINISLGRIVFPVYIAEVVISEKHGVFVVSCIDWFTYLLQHSWFVYFGLIAYVHQPLSLGCSAVVLGHSF